MPKLDKTQVKNVDEASTGSYLIPEGRYAARLALVTEREGNEFPNWSWEFEAIHDVDGDTKAGRQWVNTSLSPKAAWKVKEVFEAFGYTADSDTDEMVGEWAVLTISQEVQNFGKKKGEIVNRVDKVTEFDASMWDFNPDEVVVAARKGETAGAGTGAGDDTF